MGDPSHALDVARIGDVLFASVRAASSSIVVVMSAAGALLSTLQPAAPTQVGSGAQSPADYSLVFVAIAHSVHPGSCLHALYALLAGLWCPFGSQRWVPRCAFPLEWRRHGLHSQRRCIARPPCGVAKSCVCSQPWLGCGRHFCVSVAPRAIGHRPHDVGCRYSQCRTSRCFVSTWMSLCVFRPCSLSCTCACAIS
jgi:hypothetical protein